MCSVYNSSSFRLVSVFLFIYGRLVIWDMKKYAIKKREKLSQVKSDQLIKLIFSHDPTIRQIPRIFVNKRLLSYMIEEYLGYFRLA